MQIEQIQEEVKIESSKGRVGEIIREVEAVEELVKKRLALKEERVEQLLKEIEIENEEKVHLYQINCQLQKELAQIKQSRI